MKRALFVVVFLLSGFALRAQSSDLDLDFAFDQLKTNGPTPFAKALYETNLEEARVLVKHLAPLVEGSGEYLGYELLSRKPIGRRVERLVLAAYYARRPLYIRLDVYESTTAKICLSAAVSREASEILPFDIISAVGR